MDRVLLVSLLPSRLIPIGDDCGGEGLPSAPSMGVLQGYPSLFNIYIRLLDELIHCHRMRYHEYADDIQLCIYFWAIK